MIVISITGLRQKKRLLLRILLALLLLLALLPFLFNQYLNARTANTAAEAEADTITYPGDPVRVSTEFDRFWLRLMSESAGV